MTAKEARQKRKSFFRGPPTVLSLRNGFGAGVEDARQDKLLHLCPKFNGATSS